MTDPTSPDTPPIKPPEPLTRIDWLAVAPWLLLLRAPRAVIGWPWLIAAIGAVFFAPFGGTPRGDQGLGDAAAVSLLTPTGAVAELLHDLPRFGVLNWIWWLVVAVAWIALGCLIADQATPGLNGSPVRTLRESIRHSPKAIVRVLSSLGLVLVAMAPFAAALWLYGLLLEVPGLAGLLVWLMPLIGIVAAIPFALLLVGGLLGTPLLIAAITIEDADAFDALSRAFAYLFQRLLTMAWCLFVTACLGLLCGAILDGVFRVAVQSLSFVAIGGETAAGPEAIGAALRVFSRVVHAFWPAYLFTAGVAIYLVMRQAVDGQPLDETAQSADAA